jgi:hypothetical protein
MRLPKTGKYAGQYTRVRPMRLLRLQGFSPEVPRASGTKPNGLFPPEYVTECPLTMLAKIEAAAGLNPEGRLKGA